MKRLILILLAAGLSACWHPPFNEDIALAVSTAEKMEKVFEVSFSGFPENGTLLPVPASTILGGFVIIDEPEDVAIKFQTRSFSSNEERSGVPLPVFDGMDRFYSQVFGTLGSTPRMLQYIPGAPDPSTVWDEDVLVLAYSVSTRVFEFADSYNFLSDAVHPLYFAGLSPAPALGDLNLSGVHLYPSSDMSTAICHALIYQASENSIYELKFTINSSGAASYTENINWERSEGLLEKIPVPAEFSIPEKAAYFYSPDSGMSYINIQENGTYRSVRWSALETPVELEIQEKILAVLTGGDILTEREGRGRVYSSRGELKFSIPLGDLRFEYETYLDGKAVIVFSYRHIFDGDTVYSVYTHPTAELAGLK